MDFSNLTLGELLSSTDPIIKRNALSILKQQQRENDKQRGLKEKKDYQEPLREYRICQHYGCDRPIIDPDSDYCEIH